MVFPFVGWLPLHPPEAVQLFAVLDHESATACPLSTADGDAAMNSNKLGLRALALQGQSAVATRMVTGP